MRITEVSVARRVSDKQDACEKGRNNLDEWMDGWMHGRGRTVALKIVRTWVGCGAGLLVSRSSMMTDQRVVLFEGRLGYA